MLTALTVLRWLPNPLPTDYETRTISNSPQATDRQLLVEEDMLMKSLYGFFRGWDNIVHHRPALHLFNVKQIQATMRFVVTTYLYTAWSIPSMVITTNINILILIFLTIIFWIFLVSLWRSVVGRRPFPFVSTLACLTRPCANVCEIYQGHHAIEILDGLYFLYDLSVARRSILLSICYRFFLSDVQPMSIWLYWWFLGYLWALFVRESTLLFCGPAMWCST